MVRTTVELVGEVWSIRCSRDGISVTPILGVLVAIGCGLALVAVAIIFVLRFRPNSNSGAGDSSSANVAYSVRNNGVNDFKVNFRNGPKRWVLCRLRETGGSMHEGSRNLASPSLALRLR